MRPRTLMMPVNIARLSQAPNAAGVAGVSTSTPRSGDGPGEDAQIAVDRRDAVEAQRGAFFEPLERPESGKVAPDAEQLRRDVDEELVDQAFAHERAVQLVPGLDMQFVDAALAEIGQHRCQVDLSASPRN